MNSLLAHYRLSAVLSPQEEFFYPQILYKSLAHPIAYYYQTADRYVRPDHQYQPAQILQP